MKTPLYLLLALVLTVSCNDDDNNEPDACSIELICTEEYRSILISIQDSEGNPFVLDEYRVTNTRSMTFVSFTFPNDLITEGSYVIAEDQHFDEVRKSGTNFLFEGFLDDQKVIEENYSIGHDCCHVIKVSGPDVIVIN